jgi:hypothetical protein
MAAKRTRDDELDYLKDFLIRNGIEPFWAHSALGWVRRVMAGNTHWVTDLRYPRVSQSKEFKGVIRRLTVDCTLHGESASVPGKIVYTFQPGKGGHRVEIKAI